MENYRELFVEQVYARMEQYIPTGLAFNVNTPARYARYQAVRQVLAMRFAPERIFKQGGNSGMDRETYFKLMEALNEILPDKNPEYEI